MTGQWLVDSLSCAVLKLGYIWFDSGEYNLNIVGIRGPSREADSFDDLITCSYIVGGRWRMHVWPATTDPGRHYLENPVNAKGCAILAPGQYCGAYQIGMHRNKYPALVQKGKVRVWRDTNRDAVLDWGEDLGIAGYYGINIHRAAPLGLTASPSHHSAGCQVLSCREEHDALMALVRRAAGIWGEKFTYTLINASDM